MKILFCTLIILTMITACEQSKPLHYDSFEEYPIYNGDDLGVTYTPKQTIIKVWSPDVEAMTLHLYEQGYGGERLESRKMYYDDGGIWMIRLKGDWKNTYYTIQVRQKGKELQEVPDVYVKAVGANGHRGMIVDLKSTNPEGWENEKAPEIANYNDIIIYELHVRDLSSHPNSGIKHSGKFLGLTELNTTSPEGLSTGLQHIKDLGVTDIHLLPSFDFLPRSVDETNPKEKFNWGYDPQNYNVPEGSYATNPYDGNIRIKEFKQMVKTLHENGLRVVMDVVYNHTGETETSHFNQTVPGYYYRFREDGTFSNASACGNETASERYMMRKFMIESLKYWVEEYHIDGFRVDLMGIHDIETMNLIAKELKAINPKVFIYGEGWTGGDSPLPLEKRALKHHTKQLKHIAAFSDDIRDGLKGSVFSHEDRGFVSGKLGMEETIKFGVVAATKHPQIEYDRVNYSNEDWANEPAQTINYVSCHDNHTLYDKLKISCVDEDEVTIEKMHRLAQTIVLTSQGVPFLHAGTEMMRTKDGVENSYQSPDVINQLDWSRKNTYQTYFEYLQKLINLRKTHPAFRMTSTEDIVKHLQFLEVKQPNVVAYQISNHANGDSWKNIIVIFNSNQASVEVAIPKEKWIVVLEEGKIDEKGLQSFDTNKINVPGVSAMILAN